MCGRVRIVRPWSEIHAGMSLTGPPQDLAESWNLCPTQNIIAVTTSSAGRVGSLTHWGMIPPWAEEPKMKFPTFNARGETYQEKASFRHAWKAAQRCLIVIDGYYEWRKSDKQPFALAYKDRRPMAIAGLWETWRAKDGSQSVTSCTMITTDASPHMAQLHDREPAFLDAADWPLWLGEEEGAAAALVQPYQGDDIEWWAVGPAVGNVRNQGPDLAEPIA